tara:strand:- start:2661 stop:3242 length:582 start_codon:yes stop_codon:yes gene_type:complete
MAEVKNYHTIRYGQSDGEIKFGHITQDNVLSSVLLRNGKSKNHYITMDSSGAAHRKYGTICRSPGSFQVRAGDNVDEDVPGVYVEAVSGDLVLRAPSGRVRIEGVNIDLIASGADGQNGVITIDANEKILMRAQTIDISSKVSTRLFSEKTVELIGNGILNMYGGLIDAADGATSLIGSKGGSTNEDQNRSII